MNIELRRAVCRISSRTLEELKEVMSDSSNWVSLLGRFGYEKALSDYIALYPHHLEDALAPHPNKRIREKVFGDRSRLDVLLIDQDNNSVIVECKQGAPTVADIRQLRHYVRCLERETGETVVRGILVHGGARKLRPEVKREADKAPRIDMLQYKLEVDFVPSY